MSHLFASTLNFSYFPASKSILPSILAAKNLRHSNQNLLTFCYSCSVIIVVVAVAVVIVVVLIIIGNDVLF